MTTSYLTLFKTIKEKNFNYWYKDVFRASTTQRQHYALHRTV